MSALNGIPIVISPAMREDECAVIDYGQRAYRPTIIIGDRRLTEPELAGKWAAWFVRKSFADAGFPTPTKVGREPTRDNCNLLARIRLDKEGGT